MTRILLLGLATWRLTKLFTWEFGPFDIFAKLRSWAGVEYNEYNNPVSETFLGQILACFWCFSIYAAIVSLIIPKPILYILAISGLSILIEDKK